MGVMRHGQDTHILNLEETSPTDTQMSDTVRPSRQRFPADAVRRKKKKKKKRSPLLVRLVFAFGGAVCTSMIVPCGACVRVHDTAAK